MDKIGTIREMDSTEDNCLIPKQRRTLKFTFGIGIPAIIIGSIATVFNLWFSPLLLLLIGFFVLPVGFFWASFQFPEKTVSHCIMCQAGEHKDCLHPRNSVFCCCTTEIDRDEIALQEKMEEYATEISV